MRSTHMSRAPRARRLSLDEIVRATLELVDSQGIGSATMRSIANALGVEAMSLYRYVGNRDELFDALVDRIVNELSDDPEVNLTPVSGWASYLEALAHGVRRYALAHPHAFPLIATRPTQAPWINPPLRSLRWIEAFLAGLSGEGFTDDQVVWTYRAFNSFLLGHLLLETSSIVLKDPLPGDGTFQSGSAADPVPGGLSPTRTDAHEAAIANADTATERIDPLGGIDAQEFPFVHRLAPGLAEERYDDEFAVGLAAMLDQIERQLSEPV